MQKYNLSDVQLTFWQQLTKKHQLDIDLEAQSAEVLTRLEFGWDSIAEVTTGSATVSYTLCISRRAMATADQEAPAQKCIDLQAHTADVLIILWFGWDFQMRQHLLLSSCH